MSIDIVRHWRLKAQRYNFIGQSCPDCNKNIFPPRPVCPHCAEMATPIFPWNVEEIMPPERTVTATPRVVGEKSAKMVTAVTVQTVMREDNKLRSLRT
jgi:hypothetical protein